MHSRACRGCCAAAASHRTVPGGVYFGVWYRWYMHPDSIVSVSAAGGLLHFLRVSKGHRPTFAGRNSAADSLCSTCAACHLVVSCMQFCSHEVCSACSC